MQLYETARFLEPVSLQLTLSASDTVFFFLGGVGWANTNYRFTWITFQTAFTAFPSVVDNTKSVTVTVGKTPLKSYE